MRISVGSDHRGLETRAHLLELLKQLGHEPIDDGTRQTEHVDYPDIAGIVADRVARGEVERGILICGTGIGMAIAANKVTGVRAATCHDEIAAEMSRRHNDTNVLCLASDVLRHGRLEHLIRLWLDTPFEGGRHARRLEKIRHLERSGRAEPAIGGLPAGPLEAEASGAD